MAELTCEEFQALSAELALGIVGGRERADALAHVAHCPTCHTELAALGDVADELVGLTPSAEPPVGFETRVLAALATRPHEAARPRRLAGLRRRSVSLTLAAAVLAVAVGIGGWAIGHASSGPSAPVAGRAPAASVATLTAEGRRVGQVVVSTGAAPWMAMAVNTSLSASTVTCVLRERDGATVKVGTFALTNGYGYWAAPVPTTSSPLTGAELVDGAGATVATATFSPV